MSEIEELRAELSRLSALKDATPIADPSYPEIKEKHAALSDLLENMQSEEIDEAK